MICLVYRTKEINETTGRDLESCVSYAVAACLLKAVDILELWNIALGFMNAAEPDLSRNSTSYMVSVVLWGCAKEILTTQGANTEGNTG